MKEGKTRGEVAAEVGVSRMTLWRDLQALDTKFGAENSERVRELKAKVGEALLKAADEVWQGKVPAEVANAWASTPNPARWSRTFLRTSTPRSLWVTDGSCTKPSGSARRSST
jgi:hypothetical protein